MATENETCSYTASKDDPSSWHGEQWKLGENTWECPHNQLEGDEYSYCAFHTDPEDVPDHIDEAELFVETVNEVSAVDDDELARRKKEFVGATFGQFELPEESVLSTDDDYPIRFDHAMFSEGIIADKVTFEQSILAGATQFITEDDRPVSFERAKFSDGGFVSFRRAKFSGDGPVSFSGTQFGGDDLMSFGHAKFSCDGRVDFFDTEFSGDGPVDFLGAKFSGGGPVSFMSTKFNGDGPVDFLGAKFSGDGSVDFLGAEFSGGGRVGFENVKFNNNGDVSFQNLDLSGVSLGGTDFSGVNLQAANLSGADLRGTNLSRSNLREADLSDTKIDGSTRCGRLSGHPEPLLSRLRTAVSTEAQQSRESQSEQEDSEPDWDAIARSYHALKSRFSEHGLVGEARQHHMLEREARGREARATGDTMEYVGSVASRLVTGYGVDYRRVLLLMLLLFIPSTLVYLYSGITGYQGLGSSLYYSVVTFTTSPPADPPSGIPAAVAMVETFLGTLLIVLLGYVLGNRESF